MLMHVCSFSSQPTTKLFIDGKFIESKTSEWLDIHNPVSNCISCLKNPLIFSCKVATVLFSRGITRKLAISF